MIFRAFPKLARPLQSVWHRRIAPLNRLKKEMEMTQQSTFTSKLAAAASAFVLSLVLITGTVSMPQTAQAQTVYVGDLA